MSVESIAFLGLGVMGGPMTANLARRGFQVKAWNRTSDRPGITLARQAGAKITKSLPEAIKDAGIIFSCLGDLPDVEEVLLGENGVVNHAQPETLVVEMSTIGSQGAIAIGQKLQERGLRFLDAPVSGGDIGAQQGTLTIMVGGDPRDFQTCQPFLEAMGKNIYHCGPIGSGQAVKLCNQILVSLYMVGLCEATQMARAQNLDPNLVIEVCSTGAAASWALSNLGPKIVAADFTPGFMIKHILKDLRLVQETLQANSQSLPGVDLAEHLFQVVRDLDQGPEQGTQGMIRAYLKQ
ncbi:NAD(P)-dependent oxidoreductase [Gloeocapsa sp. PCC 73106]|uniref:NAD(P)-dependent oxidoreductase n=1 Tax=Gloeocapsa sp. PCC 73106 TaxID=102232 RepID=UPI0002AD1BA5|nr:NAD(P)-dependent oxidoreductase [Gloeocapsa sp. PCC 73106]ELR99336.1 beta-hydroxyacid dehydrogenase, 3-hydroxyisobutyrate dehydrogenase [Gloeocapsa sp. PCC 73106]